MTIPKYGQNIVQVDLDTITDALGALTDAAAIGDPDNVTTAMSYLKQIVNLLLADATVGPFTYLDAGGEQDVVEDLSTTRRHINVEFDLTAMTQNGTIRLYRKVDGVTYQIFSEVAFVAADVEQVFEYVFSTNQDWRLTYQEAVDEGANRLIPFNVITEVKE